MRDNEHNAELDDEEIAAIREEMQKEDSNIDRFFLLKLHATFLLCLYFSMQMFFFPEGIIFWLQLSRSSESDQIENVLTLRGVFILTYLLAAMMSWRTSRYTELVFGSAAILAATNVLLDVPFLWEAMQENGLTRFLYSMSLRVLIVVLLVSIFRNLDRATYLDGKLFTNPFAPLWR